MNGIDMERIKEVLDEFGVQYDWHKNDSFPGKEYYAIIEFWTDTAGQDIPTEFGFDGTAEDFVKEFTEAAERYDVDEEVKLYIEMLGKNGVPDSVRVLLEDIEEAKETLMKIAEKLKEVVR